MISLLTDENIYIVYVGRIEDVNLKEPEFIMEYVPVLFINLVRCFLFNPEIYFMIVIFLELSDTCDNIKLYVHDIYRKLMDDSNGNQNSGFDAQ